MPNPSLPGFYCKVRFVDEPEDQVWEVFIAQTLDCDDDDGVFFYAGDYPEEHIRRTYSKENAYQKDDAGNFIEDWYIVDEEERNA